MGILYSYGFQSFMIVLQVSKCFGLRSLALGNVTHSPNLPRKIHQMNDKHGFSVLNSIKNNFEGIAKTYLICQSSQKREFILILRHTIKIRPALVYARCCGLFLEHNSINS